MRTIKRYPNRKLYDTSDRRYVTLEEVEGLVRRGQEVRVVDHATGEDFTGSALSHILFERRRKRGPLPRSFLEGIIRSGGKLKDFVTERFDHVFAGKVEAALKGLGIPTRHDVEALRRRVGQLERRLRRYQKGAGG